jgi:putative ABC transport system ATP-binding protein
MNSPVIKLRNINYSINSKSILKSINTDICSDGITGIIGPSGSGKSTLLRIMNRLISPDSGNIFFRDKNYNDLSPNLLRKQIGLVNQSPDLFEGTVEYNITYGPFIWGETPDDRRKREILEISGLNNDFCKRDVNSLSTGEQQRVNLARTLANRPEVILLDEPTSNLDFVSEEIIEATLKNLNSEGIKIIIVTHSLEQTKRLSDCLLFIKNGEVLEYTKTQTFFKENDPEKIKSYFKKN